MGSSGDYHAFYAAAHHDTWWAKSQQWSVAGWVIALLGGIAGVARVSDASVTFLAALALVVSLGGVAYIARLHLDMIRARQITAKLRELHPPLMRIAEKLPGWAERTPEDVRGAFFPLLLVLAIATAHGISTDVLLRSAWAAGSAIAVLIIGLGLVAWARAAA